MDVFIYLTEYNILFRMNLLAINAVSNVLLST